MKRIEIIVSSEREEEISLEVMQGAYGSLLAHGYDRVAVRMETIPEAGEEKGRRDLAQELQLAEFQVPDFLKRQGCYREGK